MSDRFEDDLMEDLMTEPQASGHAADEFDEADQAEEAEAYDEADELDEADEFAPQSVESGNKVQGAAGNE